MTEPQPLDVAGVLTLRGATNVIAPDPADRRERPEEAADRAARALQSRLAMYHVPSLFRGASYADLTPQQNPDGKVTRWWASDARTLILQSKVKGNGKTHVAYAVGNEVVREPGVWTLAWSMVDLNEVMRPSGDEFAYDMARECELLILDDLGGERMTEWTLEKLGGLINTRWSEGRRTIVTTNLTGPDVQERYGERIVDRLIDGSWFVEVTGPSRRKPAPW